LFLETNHVSTLLFKPEIYSYLTYNYQRSSQSKVIEQILETTSHYAYLKTLTATEDSLKSHIMTLGHSELSKLYDGIRTVTQDLSSIFKISIRLKQMFDYAPDITGSVTFNEAVKIVIEHIIEALECEKSNIYQVDLLNGQLWTQAGTDFVKSSKSPLSEAVVGVAVLGKDILNIRDAVNDPRVMGRNFGIYDLLGKGYRAKTILAYPILNRMGEVEGVIEAVNKNVGADGEIRYFSEDDEGLLKMLARIAGVSLRNSALRGEAHLKHNNLRSILACGVFLNTLRSSKELQEGAENRLTQLFTSSDAKVWFLDNAEKTIWRYDQDSQKVSYGQDMGIVGQAISKKTVIDVSDPNLEFCYNSRIDINTTMPILAVPIKDSFTGKILGGFEVINSKGIEGLSLTGNAKVMSNDYDVLDFFSKQLAQCILNQNDRERGMDFMPPRMLV
jgi:GAF domain-containing protein